MANGDGEGYPNPGGNLNIWQTPGNPNSSNSAPGGGSGLPGNWQQQTGLTGGDGGAGGGPGTGFPNNPFTPATPAAPNDGGISPDDLILDGQPGSPTFGHLLGFKRTIEAGTGNKTVYGYQTTDLGDSTTPAGLTAISTATGIPEGALGQKIAELKVQNAKTAEGGYGQFIGANPDGSFTFQMPDGTRTTTTNPADMAKVGISVGEIQRGIAQVQETNRTLANAGQYQVQSAQLVNGQIVYNVKDFDDNITQHPAGQFDADVAAGKVPGVSTSDLQQAQYHAQDMGFQLANVANYGQQRALPLPAAPAPAAPTPGTMPQYPAPTPTPGAAPSPLPNPGGAQPADNDNPIIGTGQATQPGFLVGSNRDGADASAYAGYTPSPAPSPSGGSSGGTTNYATAYQSYQPSASGGSESGQAVSGASSGSTGATNAASMGGLYTGSMTGGVGSMKPGDTSGATMSTQGLPTPGTQGSSAASNGASPGSLGSAYAQFGSGYTGQGVNLSGAGMSNQGYSQQLQGLHNLYDTTQANYNLQTQGMQNAYSTYKVGSGLTEAANGSQDRNLGGMGFSGIGPARLAGT